MASHLLACPKSYVQFQSSFASRFTVQQGGPLHERKAKAVGPRLAFFSNPFLFSSFPPWPHNKTRSMALSISSVSRQYSCDVNKQSGAMEKFKVITAAFEVHPLRINTIQAKFAVRGARNRKRNTLKVSRPVFGNRNLGISNNETLAADSVRTLLESFFEQTQKLEEQSSSEGIQVEFDLELLESGFQEALAALRKKEEDLKDAESRVLLEQTEINRVKKELKQREEEIVVAEMKHERIEQDLKQANGDLVAQARLITDLRLAINERNQEMINAQSLLALKEQELDEMRNEVMKKTDETKRMASSISAKEKLLHQANEVIKKQAFEIQNLEEAINAKEQELKEEKDLRKIENEKLKVAEAKLEQQTVEWLSAQDELKRRTEEAHRHMEDNIVTVDALKRVKKVLRGVRSELVSSQKSLAISRRKMEEQEHQLEKQLEELEEQKLLISSHMQCLINAENEVQGEKAKLQAVEAKNIELEQELSMEKKLIEQLQEELNKERSSLEQTTQQVISLQSELDRRASEFTEAQSLLQVKESELAEARLLIQHLHAEQASMKLLLEEKDVDISDIEKELIDLSREFVELKELLSSKEELLTQSSKMLQEKDKNVHLMQRELDDTKMKFSEAATLVERVTNLTNQLVVSIKDEGVTSLDFSRRYVQMPKVELEAEMLLEKELEIARDGLRAKDMEVMAAQRALAVRDEELKTIRSKLDEKEKELMMLNQLTPGDTSGLRELFALAQERIRGKNLGDLAIEKLELESAQLEVEAATSALRGIANMIGELLKQSSLEAHVRAENAITGKLEPHPELDVNWRDRAFAEAQRHVAQLSALTERLLKEAGIGCTVA